MTTPIINRIPIDDSITRTCLVCNKPKQLNLDFRFHSVYSCYSKYCKDCENLRRRLKYANLIIPKEFDILIKPLRIKKVYENKPYRKTNEANRKRLNYKSEDLKRGFENNLTVEFVEQSLSSSCEYCGYPPTGLDRIDTTKGHTIENCVPCCYECNLARNNHFSYDEMKILGITIQEIKLRREHIINN